MVVAKWQGCGISLVAADVDLAAEARAGHVQAALAARAAAARARVLARQQLAARRPALLQQHRRLRQPYNTFALFISF